MNRLPLVLPLSSLFLSSVRHFLLRNHSNPSPSASASTATTKALMKQTRLPSSLPSPVIFAIFLIFCLFVSGFFLCPHFSMSVLLFMFIIYSACFFLLSMPILHPALLSSFMHPSHSNPLQEKLSSTPLLLRMSLAITIWYFSLQILFSALIIMLIIAALALVAYLIERSRSTHVDVPMQMEVTHVHSHSHPGASKPSRSTALRHMLGEKRMRQKEVLNRLPKISESDDDSEFHTPRTTRHRQNHALKRVPSAMF